MIYNGFQARILDVHHEPLAEMMPEVISERSRTNGHDEIQLAEQQNQWDLEEFQSILGQQAVQDYRSSLRSEALKNVRCGAVRVRVDEDEGEGKDRRMIDERKLKFDLLNQKSKRSTHLFLAFRWVGTDHRNAQRAHELDELQNSFYPMLYGQGLQQLKSQPKNKETPDQVKDVKLKKKLVQFLGVKNKIKEKGLGMEKISILKNPSLSNQRKSFSIRARKNAIASHPFLMQLFVDGKPISIRKDPWTDEQDLSNGAMIVWMSDGALVDLGRLDLDLNDFQERNNKHVRSITLHLWDGMRKELWNNAVTFTMKGDSGLVYPTCDIKQISVPNAILHFNVIAFKESHSSRDSITEPVSDLQLRPLDEIIRASTLTVVNESSQENMLSEIQETSKPSGEIRSTENEKAKEFIPVPIPLEEATQSIEQEIQQGEFKRARVSSLQYRPRTTSLQATLLQTSHDEVYSPIRSIFEEVDRLRIEHEQLKSSMKNLDGEWRDQVVNELQRLRGEIRERVEIDKAHFEKVKKRFSLHQRENEEEEI